MKENLTCYFTKEYSEVYELIFGEADSKIASNIEVWKDGKYWEPEESKGESKVTDFHSVEVKKE